MALSSGGWGSFATNGVSGVLGCCCSCCCYRFYWCPFLVLLVVMVAAAVAVPLPPLLHQPLSRLSMFARMRTRGAFFKFAFFAAPPPLRPLYLSGWLPLEEELGRQEGFIFKERRRRYVYIQVTQDPTKVQHFSIKPYNQSKRTTQIAFPRTATFFVGSCGKTSTGSPAFDDADAAAICFFCFLLLTPPLVFMPSRRRLPSDRPAFVPAVRGVCEPGEGGVRHEAVPHRGPGEEPRTYVLQVRRAEREGVEATVRGGVEGEGHGEPGRDVELESESSEV